MSETKSLRFESAIFPILGQPSEWDSKWITQPIKSVGKVITGKTPPSSEEGMFNGSIPFVTPADLNRFYCEQAQRSVTLQGAVESRTVRSGATLVCCIGTIGKLSIAHNAVCFNQQINAVEWDNEFILDEFGAICLTIIRPLLIAQGSSTTLPQLPKTRFEKIQIPIPPKSIQFKVIEIFLHIQAIEQRRACQRELLSELEKSVFHSLFNDFSGNYVKLGDISDIQSGITKGRRTTLPTRSIPYLAVANVQAGYLQLETVKTIDATEVEVKKYRLAPGDIVITEGGDPDKLGRGTVWRGEIEEAIHQNHIFRVRLKDDSPLTPDYISDFLRDIHAKIFFLRNAKQTTGIATINKTQLKSLPIPIPSSAFLINYSLFKRIIKWKK